MHPTLMYHQDQITKAGLARLLGVTVRAIERWTAAGYLKPIRRSPGRPNIYSLNQVMGAVKKHFLHVAPNAIEAFDNAT